MRKRRSAADGEMKIEKRGEEDFLRREKGVDK